MYKWFRYLLFWPLLSCVHLASDFYENGTPVPGDDVPWEKVVEKVPYQHQKVRKPSQEEVSRHFPPQKIFSAVTESSTLEALENLGFRLENILGGTKNSQTLEAFYRESLLYRDFVDLTEQDISARVSEENRHREDWGPVSVSVRAKRKQLDPRWLKSRLAHYELVGLINRMDREPFNPDTCGEFRLLYRLAYETKKVSSRLPLTINLVFYLPSKEKCSDYLAEWTAPESRSPQELAQWLKRQGPLRNSRTDLKNLKSLETNYQIIRSAAGIRNMLGGSAEYVLRVFKLEGQRLKRALLENTIDPETFRRSPQLKSELLTFLRKPENLRALDQGTLKIADEFLTELASSYAPHGVARYDNRPFDKIFDPRDFKGLDFSKNQFVRTPDALIRRLDDLSCVGCHQNRTTAGFHFLGEDRAQTHELNALLFAGSGHFRAELKRRQIFLETLARGETPSHSRPFSIAPVLEKAELGDFCGLSTSKGFSNWVCAEGLKCVSVDGAVSENELGKCFPDKRLSGDPCLSNQVIQNHHSLDKMVAPMVELKCGGGHPKYTCQPPGGGFPTGMCTANCDSIQDSNREICGPIAGPGFSNCLTQPEATMKECLERTKAYASRGRCNQNISCRNDYVCARVTETEGACLPSYFLYQIRVDGHPDLDDLTK